MRAGQGCNVPEKYRLGRALRSVKIRIVETKWDLNTPCYNCRHGLVSLDLINKDLFFFSWGAMSSMVSGPNPAIKGLFS